MLGVEAQVDLAASTIAEFVDLEQIEPGQSREIELTGRDGRKRHAIMSEAPLQGADGRLARQLALVRRHHPASHRHRPARLSRANDQLTELPNLAMFTEHLELALHRAARYGTAAAVIFIDIDEFALVNEGLGREVGDELLRRVAERLRAVTRKADVVGRQSGDEFLVLLADMRPARASAGAQGARHQRADRSRGRPHPPCPADAVYDRRPRGVRRRFDRRRPPIPPTATTPGR